MACVEVVTTPGDSSATARHVERCLHCGAEHVTKFDWSAFERGESVYKTISGREIRVYKLAPKLSAIADFLRNLQARSEGN
jgi:hypothetical protein